MAGFFGLFDYTKPGPGVPKNAPPKARPRLFFEVFFRKFWKIIQINLLYTIFNIPGLFMLFIGTQFMFPTILFGELEVDLYLRLMFGAFLVCFPILCFGPAQAGMTFCLRNFAREEHAFIWSDFKEHGLKNLKESLAICLIDFAAFLLLCISINFYGQLIAEQKIWALFTFGIIALAFLLFAMMHLYIYPMLVTFHITVKQIYKNALIFATIRFLPNIGILLLCGLVIIATFIITEIGILLFVLITSSFIGLIINFYSYPTIKKYMIDRIQEAQEGEAAAGEAAAIEAAGEGEIAIGAASETAVGAESVAAIEAAGAAAIGAEGETALLAEGGVADGAGEDGEGDAMEAPESGGFKAIEAAEGGAPDEVKKTFVDGKFVERPIETE